MDLRKESHHTREAPRQSYKPALRTGHLARHTHTRGGSSAPRLFLPWMLTPPMCWVGGESNLYGSTAVRHRYEKEWPRVVHQRYRLQWASPDISHAPAAASDSR